MVKVGIIGYGKWGIILHSKLKSFCDVKFTCRSRDTYVDKLDDVDWVVVSTPDETHFEIVMNCIQKNKNVFCEKPLTLNHDESQLLYALAESKGVKLYVDDVLDWKTNEFDFYKDKINYVSRRKKDGSSSHSSFKTKDLLPRLTYHDIYNLYWYIKNLEIEDVIPIDIDNKLHFKVLFDSGTILEFLYDVDYDGDREHNMNGVSLMNTGKEDPLYKMLYNVLTGGECNYNHNKDISLFAQDFIEKVEKKLFKKVAVIGAGVFGCTIAECLSMKGHRVDLFEKTDDILSHASGVNQYRLHRGYHYPRSKETAQSSIEGETSFLETYRDSIMNGKIEHYYCIAKEDSLVTAQQYKEFLDDVKLDYEEKKLDLINKNVVDLTIKADEFLFNPERLRKICWINLVKSGVNIKLKTECNSFDDYDYVVNATYANLNHLLPEDKQKDYQFELCEKPVVKLPDKYKNKSVVIMDGPFMCIDPLGDTPFHVMGNVVHAIHSTNVGKFPEYDEKFDGVLNKGIVKNPTITNIDKFIESAKTFFVDIDKAEHIGSMFTFRTVLPNKDKDDARPTLVEKIDDKTFNVFSGKIGTCVDAAKEVIDGIK